MQSGGQHFQFTENPIYYEEYSALFNAKAIHWLFSFALAKKDIMVNRTEGERGDRNAAFDRRGRDRLGRGVDSFFSKKSVFR